MGVSERQASLGSGFLYGLYQNRLRRFLATQTLPRHVAMIIDGNRRWARLRELETAAHGHRAGAAKYREFLVWCDDLGMEPVLAVFAGYVLKHDYVPAGPKLAPYVQDALDEIEYVTGDASTKWGAQRIKDGYPNPFPLHLAAENLPPTSGNGLRIQPQ